MIDAAHHLRQRPGERQPDPGAVDAACLGAEPVERGEEPVLHRRVDSRAVVADAERDLGRSPACQASHTWPPGWLYLMALESRFSRIWRSRWRSAST